MIPQNFESWLTCITKQCGIDLTKEFAQSRMEQLTNINHPDTKRFVELYGEKHHENVTNWFKHILFKQ